MANDEPLIAVEVVYSPVAGQVLQVPLRLSAGVTAGAAIEQSGLLARCPELDLHTMKFGVWGRVCTATELLRDRDRVEIYRPLKVDPKEARRLRARQQPTKRQIQKKKPGQ